jgi:hypothetical protein
MELWDYGLTYSETGRAQFRQCEAIDITPRGYGLLGVEQTRCGGYAMRGVSWVGELSGETHRLLVCDRHTHKYIGPMIKEEKR